jgi:hypothetical protein
VMSKCPSTVKQADITRALKAAQKAGVRVRIRVGRDGMLIEMVDANGEAAMTEMGNNPWDGVLKHAAD